MALGRIPGSLGLNQISGATVNTPKPLGSAAPVMKQVPKGVSECIFFPPPRLSQREIYKGEEAIFGCWCTSAEMIVKWRNEAAPFKRPRFEHMIPSGDLKERIAFMDLQHKLLTDWGFETVPGSLMLLAHFPVSRSEQAEQPAFKYDPSTMIESETRALASTLNAYGPLYCVGDFWPGAGSNAVGGLKHAIVVFGAQEGIVYYRDPDGGQIKRMSPFMFGEKLLRDVKNVYRYVPHERWKSA